MKWLYVLCEGQTEEAFVKEVLAPHLMALGIAVVEPIVLGLGNRGKHRGSTPLCKGGGVWRDWALDIRNHLLEHKSKPGRMVRFTTLIDLYGLPRDFPVIEPTEPNPKRRAAKLEALLTTQFSDHRLIPYLQVHEFEALVLASLDALDDLLDPEDAIGMQTLRSAIGATAPEDVNDSPVTAPSKRLKATVPAYDKVFHGPVAIEETGLEAVRSACPRFGAWLTTLEAFAAE